MDDETSQQAHCASPKDNTDVASTHDFSDGEIDNEEEEPYYEETPRELRGYTRSGRPVYSVRRLLVPYPGKDHAKDMQDLEECEADPDMDDKRSTDSEEEDDEDDDEDEYHECEGSESDGEGETETESESETETEEEEDMEEDKGGVDWRLVVDAPPCDAEPFVRNLQTQ